MNNTDPSEETIKHQQNNDPKYLGQEHLLAQLRIHVDKKMQDNMSSLFSGYGINYSIYMVLTILSTADNHYLSPSKISRELQFTKTNITRTTDFSEKAGYIGRTDSREDRRAKKISLTSDGLSLIQSANIAQSPHLKEIWSPLTHVEHELFEDINKKPLMHIADVCP